MKHPGFRKTKKNVILRLTQCYYGFRRLIRRGSYSNFGEQEIIEKYIGLLNIEEKSRVVVDIGAGDGVRNSNTYALVEKGWKALGIEYDSRKEARLASAYKFYPDAYPCRFLATSSNITELLSSYSIEKNFGVLSLDIDGCDYWVLDKILNSFRPCLVVSEYNEKIPLPVRFVVNDTPDFSLRHHFFGYSIAMLKDILAKHSYVLLEVEYNNVFIAPAELASRFETSIERGYREGYVDRPDRKEKFKTNENMEILHTLPPSECIQFLNDFYVAHNGEYQISLETNQLR